MCNTETVVLEKFKYTESAGWSFHSTELEKSSFYIVCILKQVWNCHGGRWVTPYINHINSTSFYSIFYPWSSMHHPPPSSPSGGPPTSLRTGRLGCHCVVGQITHVLIGGCSQTCALERTLSHAAYCPVFSPCSEHYRTSNMQLLKELILTIQENTQCLIHFSKQALAWLSNEVTGFFQICL